MILVVDDDLDICKLVETSFKEVGIPFLYCETIEHAKAEIDKSKFDMILLDISLSDGNGGEIIQYIREQNHDNIDTPIIIMSTYVNNEFSERIKDNVFSVLKKPFDSKQLLLAINPPR
ncbi:hypothetical protein A9Q84_15490 [Halobacteriovorax marinus]|uniref:Response regulatory domain-containing protein n=1 Tax=Halobacteriovorax marinus TaxID=97084 RepID=A0A1Y5F451_9BACT|nr:hypothetical protein A9Q84_15490 [Halobacteriovorax marinus]